MGVSSLEEHNFKRLAEIIVRNFIIIKKKTPIEMLTF